METFGFTPPGSFSWPRPLSWTFLLASLSLASPASEAANPGFWDALYAESARAGIQDFGASWQDLTAARLLQVLDWRLELRKELRLVVFGGGDAALCQELLQQGLAEVTAVDFSSALSRQRPQLDGVRWLVEDVRKQTSLDASSFDVVLELGTLDAAAAVPGDGAPGLLREARRLLRAGGLLVSASMEPPQFRLPLLAEHPAGGWADNAEILRLARRLELDPRIKDLDPAWEVENIFIYLSRAAGEVEPGLPAAAEEPPAMAAPAPAPDRPPEAEQPTAASEAPIPATTTTASGDAAAGATTTTAAPSTTAPEPATSTTTTTLPSTTTQAQTPVPAPPTEPASPPAEPPAPPSEAEAPPAPSSDSADGQHGQQHRQKQPEKPAESKEAEEAQHREEQEEQVAPVPPPPPPTPPPPQPSAPARATPPSPPDPPVPQPPAAAEAKAEDAFAASIRRLQEQAEALARAA